MASGTPKRNGPTALTATLTTNVYNNSSALIYDVVTTIEIVNKTGTAATVTLYIGETGANAAGTEIFLATSVPANSSIFWRGRRKLTSADFIVGGASAGSTLNFIMDSEQFVV